MIEHIGSVDTFKIPRVTTIFKVCLFHLTAGTLPSADFFVSTKVQEVDVCEIFFRIGIPKIHSYGETDNFRILSEDLSKVSELTTRTIRTIIGTSILDRFCFLGSRNRRQSVRSLAVGTMFMFYCRFSISLPPTFWCQVSWCCRHAFFLSSFVLQPGIMLIVVL